jgi:hypothetical protein
LHDALQLDVLCNYTAAAAVSANSVHLQTKHARLKRQQNQEEQEQLVRLEQGVHRQQGLAEYFVSVFGDDSAAGTLTAPFKTPQRGVLACRIQRETAADEAVCTVYLRKGLYSIKAEQPLTIAAADSFLTIQSYNGEVAELSGAVPLQGLEWARVPVDIPGRQQQQHPASGNEGLPYAGGAGAANPNVTIWVAKVNLAHIAALRVQGKIAPKARYPNVVDVESLGSRGPLDGFISVAAASYAWIEPDFSNTSAGVDHVSTAADWPGVEWIATNNRPTGAFFLFL